MMYINGSHLIYNLDVHFSHGLGKRVDKFLFIKPCCGNHYVVPRELIFKNKDGQIWPYNTTAKEYLSSAIVWNDDDYNDSECADCEYSEMCNGQLCLFAMM